jgi:hypothetical protein
MSVHPVCVAGYDTSFRKSFTFSSSHRDSIEIGATQACHKLYLLPGGAKVKIRSSGRPHVGSIAFSFCGEGSRPCLPLDWPLHCRNAVQGENSVTEYASNGAARRAFQPRSCALNQVLCAAPNVESVYPCRWCARTCVDVAAYREVPMDTLVDLSRPL